jgi:hypothetical protein
MSYDLNALQTDVCHLTHLLDAIVDASLEIPDDAHRQMPRLAALAWVARDLATKCSTEIETGFAVIGSTCHRPDVDQQSASSG